MSEALCFMDLLSNRRADVTSRHPSSSQVASGTYFVLVGGDAFQSQGGDPMNRDFMHTSVPFIGSAYGQLRRAGVQSTNIITIAQVQEYMEQLVKGAHGVLDTGIERKFYAAQMERTRLQCKELLEEGCADWDYSDVNPGMNVNGISSNLQGLSLA